MQYHVMYSDEEQQLCCTVAEQLPCNHATCWLTSSCSGVWCLQERQALREEVVKLELLLQAQNDKIVSTSLQRTCLQQQIAAAYVCRSGELATTRMQHRQQGCSCTCRHLQAAQHQRVAYACAGDR
jgi:hypothetical protein